MARVQCKMRREVLPLLIAPLKGRSMSNKQSRPNIIFVLTDDQGYGDLSCLGNPILKTPTLDGLHADSVRLTDFHVAPMCTPTRGELMTGQDALRNGATFVCMGRSLLRADLPTMADILADNGYHTGHFGKWHLGDNYPYRPQDRGFHETIHHPAFGITSAADYYGNDYFDDHYRHKDEIKQYRGYCTDVWFEEAMRWMQGCHRRNEPFFAYIATNAPHGPLWVPDEYRQPYLDGIRRDEASFFGMIANIDENMAQLEKFLLDNEIRDNTILIFMTDNGTAMGEGIYNAGMRGRKTSLYEGGHRVPCFIRWPEAGLGGGRDVGGVTRGVDILPTLIDLCDLQAPDGWTCDGLSLAAHLRRPDRAVVDRMIGGAVWTRQRRRSNWLYRQGSGGGDVGAVAAGRWAGAVQHSGRSGPAAGRGRGKSGAGKAAARAVRGLVGRRKRYAHELSAADDRLRCGEPGAPVQLRLGVGICG